MTTYNTYQEAKIANPDENIRHLDGKLFVSENSGVPYERRHDWLPANPAKYCMTVEKFLADGCKFVEGDWYIENDDSANKIDPDDVEIMNEKSKHDATIYILRAAALENQMNIDNLATQTPEDKEALDSIAWRCTCELSKSREREFIDLIGTPHQYEMSKLSGNEWNGEGLPPVGAICNWRMASGEVEICGRYGNMTWIFDIEMGAHVSVKDADGFTKIETPQQREERERLEAAYDLYCVWVGDRSGYHAIDFDKWKVEPDFLNKWLRIVDKTNYRKESN